MTGFWRPNRSYYLDCMDVKVGDIVICKCNCGLAPFTPGNSYDDSTFTMSAAYSRALEVINTHENTFLKDVDHEVFFDALDNPPEPTDALKAAFAQHAEELKR